MHARTTVAIALIVMVAAPVLLAERPDSPEVRDEEATHVLVGEVKAVYARDLETDRQGPGTVETHYLVELDVDVVERGRGLEENDLAYVRCWRVTRSGPAITSGSSGHKPIPKAGDRVRVYAARGEYGPTGQVDNGMTAVYPNGFVLLARKAAPPVAVYEWPPWVDDLVPDEPTAYPGFDIQADNPFVDAGAAPDMRYLRVHLSPGTNPDGSTRRVFAVHFRGPPGLPLAAHVASVAPSTLGWTSVRHPEATGWSFAAPGEKAPMPEAGLVLVFEVRARALEMAVWRDAQILLSNRARATLPDPGREDDALVGSLWNARTSRQEGARTIPIRLPYTPR